MPKENMRIIGKYTTLVSFIVLLWCPLFSFSQKLTATATATSIGLNNSVQVSYSLSGGKSESFQQPDFANFSIIGTSKTSGGGVTMIINGKVVQDGGGSESWIYTLTPTKTGKFTIESAKAKVGGQWISSNTLTIEVTSGTTTTTQPQNKQQQTQDNQQTQQGTASADDLFVKVFADKTNVQQGEQLTVTYKIYTKIPVTQYAIQKLPSFFGFWSFDLLKDRDKVNQYTETVNGQKYTVAEIRKVALFPQKSGRLNVEPLEVECVAQVLVKKKANNPFGNFFNDPFFNDPFFQNAFTTGYQEVKKTLKSNPLSITVNELPSANKPDDFCGLVGTLSLESKLDKTDIRANDAVNLTFTLIGKGNLTLIDKLNIEFPSDFEVYDPQITENISTAGGEISGKKIFNYLIIPRTQGKFKIKPVTLSFYDKNKKQYVSLSSGEMILNVGKGDGSGGSAVVNSSGKEDIKYIGSDIKFIENKNFEVFPIGYIFFGSTVYLILLLSSPLLFAAFVILMRRRIKLRKNIALLKHKKATKVALKRLKTANQFMKSGDKTNFYLELSKALWGYISDKFSIPMATLSLETAKETLNEKHIADAIRDKFVEILNNCEFARFAPAEAISEMEIIYNEAVEIISKTERELK